MASRLRWSWGLVFGLMIVTALVFVGCGSEASPTVQPQAPALDREEMRALVREAVSEAGGAAPASDAGVSGEEVRAAVSEAVAGLDRSGLSAEEIRGLVEEVVAEAETPTITLEDVEELVMRAVEEARDPGSLVVYSGRSQSLVDPVIQQFAEASGIDVRVKYGGTSEMAATLLEEGDNSPADVFFAQDPGGLGAVQGMMAPLPEEILERVPGWAQSPEEKWVGISGRARAVVYNTERLTESDLPDDMFGFTDPAWKGRIGWAPTNTSFQTMVTAMRALWGEDRTRQWIEGIQANDPMVYPKNTPQVAAAGAGEIDVGFVNHYYLFRFLAEEGEDFPARNYHPRNGGPGATIMVAGAAILETASNRDNAERFLSFLLSNVGQQYFASQTYEYPLVDNVNTQHVLVPLEDINAPEIALGDLADLRGTVDLLRETGVLP